MTRAALLLVLAPLTAFSQLQLTVVINGSQKISATNGQTVSIGSFAPGAVVNFVIQAANNTTAPVSVPSGTVSLSGTGFLIASTTPTIPATIAPGSALNLFMTFSGPMPASYSASVRVTGITIILMASVSPAATLFTQSPCGGPGLTNTISFSNTPVGQPVTCTITMLNETTQALTVSTVGISGTGFLFAQPPATPLSIPAGGSVAVKITLSPNSAQTYSGTLTFGYPALSQAVTLSGTAYNPPLPTPALQFDTSNPQSGQQVTLTMILPSASPIAASGSVNLAFQPASSVAASGDPNIVFVGNGAHSIGFTIAPGSTQAMLAGKPGAVFQTGTTAGTIKFTVITSAQLSGDPTTSITLPPAEISVDNAAATAIAGSLRIQVWGFDNTYSAGPMTFTFFDAAGAAIGSGALSADFTSNFHTYFSGTTDGGSFAMLVTFPITGNAAQVGSVNVQLTNSAGTTTITKLAFLNDTGTCVLVNNVLTCPPIPSQ